MAAGGSALRAWLAGFSKLETISASAHAHPPPPTRASRRFAQLGKGLRVPPARPRPAGRGPAAPEPEPTAPQACGDVGPGVPLALLWEVPMGCLALHALFRGSHNPRPRFRPVALLRSPGCPGEFRGPPDSLDPGRRPRVRDSVVGASR